MLALGTQAPDFRLPDFSGHEHALADFAGSRALLVAFICNHCPFVQHIRGEFARFARELPAASDSPSSRSTRTTSRLIRRTVPTGWRTRRAAWVTTSPTWSTRHRRSRRRTAPHARPISFSSTRIAGSSYRGQFDDSRPGNGQPVTGADLRAATDAVLAGRPVAAQQTPSVGCNIKWKPGNAPDYA